MSFAKIIPFILLTSLFIQCGTDTNTKNLLSAPENWKGEVIEFPLEFATSLQYSGIEYVRFAPEWGEESSSDYFSYVFLWNLSEDPQLSAKKLESEIETYFDGLMSSVSKMNPEQNNEISKSKAFFEKVNDSLYVGKILTYDAFTTKKEVNLNITVSYSMCELQNKHLVLFNISPKPYQHQIWKKLKKVTATINCN
ncbi:hypothetical protein ATE84_3289 [Aquimarina sp. MAR_2010_214]|uniref:hypothetical protein n=1 Tax=Aquimarina sp. MAR_2010_214 TaxID=1250026 RepID=UPI000C711396|nr:hypothetical protein [Aquimarina sp. MAR_2010_214]PKV51215.1 hypothetical protein ATE84_3289 [Aquimarina sp. MAR_2010_214]